MNPEFWHERWQKNEVGFHEGEPNTLLVRNFERADLKAGSRVFLPLCGKAYDLQWLADQGCDVVGVELSETAVADFFAQTADTVVDRSGNLIRYRAAGIEVYVGDFFDLSAAVLGKVDAIYDRAAMVALPADTRRRYAEHLVAITNAAPQLLISLDYDQTQTDGPPFAVDGEEIRRLYETHYAIEHLESVEIAGPLAKRCSGRERVWKLAACRGGRNPLR